MNFQITGLPRSRTAWFAAYFTASGHSCCHEGMRGCETIDEYISNMESFEGNSDCSIPLHSLDIPTVIIERDPDDVKDSLRVLFGTDEEFNIFIEKYIPIFVKKLNQMEGLRVEFKDINERLEEIHEYCVGRTYKPRVAEMFKDMTITTRNLYSTDKSVKLIGELLCQVG